MVEKLNLRGRKMCLIVSHFVELTAFCQTVNNLESLLTVFLAYYQSLRQWYFYQMVRSVGHAPTLSRLKGECFGYFSYKRVLPCLPRVELGYVHCPPHEVILQDEHRFGGESS